jgi:uncharacterized OB-fold protein
MTADFQNSPLATFREYLAQGLLAYQHDRETGKAVFYPRVIGPATGNPLEWRTSQGFGTVYAVTVISPKGEPSYNVVLVDMDEGFRLMSRVDGMRSEDVTIGLRVRVGVATPANDEPSFPIFVAESQ